MMKQVTEIANHKLKRFNFLTTELTMATIVVLFTYYHTISVPNSAIEVKRLYLSFQLMSHAAVNEWAFRWNVRIWEE